MNKEIYKKIKKKWNNKIYQSIGKKRMKNALRYIKFLKNKRVVDIGSNAGVITYDIAQYASAFVGVEYDKHYYTQSLETLKYIETPGTFVNSSLEDFINTTDFDYNAIFASCVLYHLREKEIELVKSIMLPKCDIVLFISREDKKPKTNNTYCLNKWKNIKRFLENANMRVQAYNVNSNWVTVVGKR
jgi:hypothetical protein